MLVAHPLPAPDLPSPRWSLTLLSCSQGMLSDDGDAPIEVVGDAAVDARPAQAAADNSDDARPAGAVEGAPSVYVLEKDSSSQKYKCPLCEWEHTSAAMLAQHMTVRKYHPDLSRVKGTALKFKCKESGYEAAGIVGRQKLDC